MLKKPKINLSGAGVTARDYCPVPRLDRCTIKYRFLLAFGVENPSVYGRRNCITYPVPVLPPGICFMRPPPIVFYIALLFLIPEL